MRLVFERMRLILGLFLLLGFPLISFAQRTDESVRVKVHNSQEDHRMQIEEDIPGVDAADVEKLMDKYGMSDELKELKPGEEVEIVIRRKPGSDDPKDVTIEVDRSSTTATQPKPATAPATTPATTTNKPLQPTGPISVTELAKPATSNAGTTAVKPTPTPTPTPKPIAAEPGRAFLGVHYEMEYGATQGSHITKVEPGTPASRAGLRPGDVITKADDVDLRVLDDLSRVISHKKAGEKVRLTYFRDGKLGTTWVTLAERDEAFFKNNPNGGTRYQLEQEYEISPSGKIWINENGSSKANEDAGGPLLGVLMIHTSQTTSVNGVQTTQNSTGAIVDEVIPNSTAMQVGLQKGDKILVVNGKHVNSATEVTNLIASMKVGDEVAIEYARNGQRRAGTGLLKNRKDFSLPSDAELNKSMGLLHIGGSGTSDVEDLIQRMMGDGPASSSKSSDYNVVMTMNDLSPADAQALSSKSGQPIDAKNDLAVQSFELVPNPMKGTFHLGFALPSKGLVSIQVLDMNGNTIYMEDIQDFSGRYAKDFALKKENKGVFVMRIAQNGKTFSRKVVTE